MSRGPKIKWPKVAIIVLNWNQKKVTANCILKLLKIDYSNFEIFVVDNGSNDDSYDFLKKKFGSRITLIWNKKNLGYAEGNNAGIKRALKENFDFVLILNNDTEPTKDFLTKLIKPAMATAKIGMLVPKVYYSGTKKKLQSVGGQIVWCYGEARLRGNCQLDKGQYDKLEEIDYAPGICVLVPTRVLKKIGRLPKDYFMYGEDVDWSLRAKSAGFKLIFVPSAEIFHQDSLSADSESAAKTYYYIRNILIFMKKWAPWQIWLYFVPCFGIKIFKMMIRYLIEGKLVNIKAVVAAKINFLRGEKGESKTHTFRYHR